MRFIFYVSLYWKDTRCKKMNTTDFSAINDKKQNNSKKTIENKLF